MTRTQRNPEETRKAVTPRMILAVVLTVFALIFVFQNTSSGDIHFLGWHFSLPTWIWILLVFLVGVLVGSLFPWFRSRRR